MRRGGEVGTVVWREEAGHRHDGLRRAVLVWSEPDPALVLHLRPISVEARHLGPHREVPVPRGSKGSALETLGGHQERHSSPLLGTHIDAATALLSSRPRGAARSKRLGFRSGGWPAGRMGI